MPEGDTIRRLADDVRRRFMEQTVQSSIFRHPRYANADLSGRQLIDVDARGKNLLMRFDDGRTVHIHLKLQGKVVFGKPTRGAEWRQRIDLNFERGRMVGIDLPMLNLLKTRDEHQIIGHLGPDLCGDYDHELAVQRIATWPDWPIAQAMLDQRLVAGFGNIYAVETPFIVGLSPFTPVGKIDRLSELIAIGAALIRTNARFGPQNTVGRRLDTSLHWVLNRNIRVCRVCRGAVKRYTDRDTPWQRRSAACVSCQRPENESVDLDRAASLLSLHPCRRLVDLKTGTLTAAVNTPVETKPQRRTQNYW